MTKTHGRRALALVGMPGSGKSVCAQHLESLGFFQMRFGGIVVREVLARGWPLTPENERIVREELRARDGMAAVAMLAIPVLREALESHSNIVIDGLYSWSEYKLLRRELSAELIVVAVVSERSVRYRRLGKRKERPLSEKEAESRDYAEIEKLEKGGPIAIADFVLVNNGKRKKLIKKLDHLIHRLEFAPA
ncbi:MAG: AAA family ATPase [Anaerolineae bacterium]|nr:AAA family ATPase [Anaerolineae bacterium]